MSKYIVSVVKHNEEEYVVEANSKEEAENKALKVSYSHVDYCQKDNKYIASLIYEKTFSLETNVKDIKDN